MPWTVSDVDRFKKGLSDSQKRQWVRIANSVLARCRARNGENCEGSAIRQANGSVGGHALYDHTPRITSTDYEIREEMFEGKPHLVVPVVMMREGVHNGSHGALFHSAAELGRYPASWDGIPITVDHPEDEEGQNISANSPEVIATQMVGRVFGTHMEGDRLSAEAWLDKERLKTLSPDAFEHVMNKLPLDVSVGVFSDEEDSPGNWNNEQYEAIARNHRPDHLALLPGGVGACSWADGCGIRINQFEPPEAGNAPQAVKNILRRVYNSCRERWVKEHPSDRENSANKTSCSRIAWTAVKNAGWRNRNGRWVLTQKMKGGSYDMNDNLLKSMKELSMEGYITAPINTNVTTGLRELISNIQGKLDRMDDDTKVHFLQEVYEDYFVYEIRRKEGESTLFKREYTINENGSIEFTGDPAQVRRKVEYVAMKEKSFIRSLMDLSKSNVKSKEVKTMSNDACLPCIKEKVDALISNEATKFQEEDREWLEAMEEEQLDKLAPPEAKKPELKVDDEGKKPEESKSPLTEDEKEAIAYGRRVRDKHRNGLIKGILDNTKKGTWTEDELKTMEDSHLEKLFESVKEDDEDVTDYSLQRVGDGEGEEDILYPPIVNLEKEEKK